MSNDFTINFANYNYLSTIIEENRKIETRKGIVKEGRIGTQYFTKYILKKHILI